MNPQVMKRSLWIILALYLCAGLPTSGLAQSGRQRPPEYQEVVQATRIQDSNLRLKELERIKKAYPESRMMNRIESAIRSTKIALATDVDTILQLQKPILEEAEGLNKIVQNFYASMNIVEHDKVDGFDKAKVTRAVEAYVKEGLRLSRDQVFLKSIPENQLEYLPRYTPMLHLAMAAAYLNEGDGPGAQEELDKYLELGGSRSREYGYALGRTQEKLGNAEAALEAYFTAAAENFRDSRQKSRELFEQVHDSLEGFEAALETKQRELPFHPVEFAPEGGWSGKTVLAEVFTGSECPPCVAADLGFDGLLEAYEPKYLAVLEYHLPIPRPDPIMNHATKLRQDFYGVNSTPTTFFDGEKKHGGGGPRANSENKFKQYSGEINSLIAAVPSLRLKAEASLTGDLVTVEFSVDKPRDGVDYNIALVQKEVKYAGSNGILFHKMVVREFVTVKDPAGTTTIDLKKSQEAAAQHLAAFEKERSFAFPEKHFTIDRSNLGIVFFAQDRATKKVLNAWVAEVQ